MPTSNRTVVWEGRSREAPPYPDLWPKGESSHSVASVPALGGTADQIFRADEVKMTQRRIFPSPGDHAGFRWDAGRERMEDGGAVPPRSVNPVNPFFLLIS
jgi:hypothetical protein